MTMRLTDAEAAGAIAVSAPALSAIVQRGGRWTPLQRFVAHAVALSGMDSAMFDGFSTMVDAIAEGDRDIEPTIAEPITQPPVMPEPEPIAPEPITPSQASGRYETLIRFFDRAAQTLRYPSVAFHIATGNTIELSRATQKSQWPGALQIKVKVQGAWLRVGRITRDGVLFVSNRYTYLRDALAERLDEFNADPEKFAAEEGNRSGKCCFCKLALTDDRSLAVGYGKVCAGRYGLPWGSK